MPALPIVAAAVTRKLPKVISPGGHALADYVSVGLFLAAGGLFWRKHRPAAVAALICGGAQLVLDLVTDYPGGAVKSVPFPAHGKFDLAIAGMTAAMPELFLFRKGRSFFLMQAAAITVTTNLTDFRSPRLGRRPFRIG